MNYHVWCFSPRDSSGCAVETIWLAMTLCKSTWPCTSAYQSFAYSSPLAHKHKSVTNTWNKHLVFLESNNRPISQGGTITQFLQRPTFSHSSPACEPGRPTSHSVVCVRPSIYSAYKVQSVEGMHTKSFQGSISWLSGTQSQSPFVSEVDGRGAECISVSLR